ncbi:hypothetical protein Tco_0556184 [Tanacetum coccineum]
MESLNSNSQERELHQLQQMQDKAKESCMESFQLLHSLLKNLSNNDLKGTRIKGGFERAFATLFDQDFHTFKATMLLNLDQLEKHLAKEEFQELESFNAFRHMESLQASIQERAKHKREYDRRMNDRMMQSKKGKVDSSKALVAGLVVMESNETKSKRHVSSSRSRKGIHMLRMQISTSKRDDDLSERNGQEKEEGASNKEDDQHVQDFRAELDNLLVQQMEGYANNTNRVSTVNPSISVAEQGFDNADDQERIDRSTQDVNTVGPSINTARENINTGSSNINTASPIPNDPSMQSLEATSIFDDAYDDR